MSKIIIKFASKFEDNGFMSRSREEYDIRTNAYYIGKGGVYAEVLTILTNMRQQPKFRGLPMPVKLMNQACFVYDNLQNLSSDNYDDNIKKIEDVLCLCIIASLSIGLTDSGTVLTWAIKPYIENDKTYYPYFVQLLKKWEDYNIQVFEESHGYPDSQRIADLEDEVNILKSQLDEAHETIENLKRTLNEINDPHQSKLDKALNLDSILEYVKSRHHYIESNQIIVMLKGHYGRLATDEEFSAIEQLEQKLLSEKIEVLDNKNIIKDSNVFTGLINNPKFPIGIDPKEMTLQEYLDYNKQYE